MDVYRKAELAFGISRQHIERFQNATPVELNSATIETRSRYIEAIRFLDDLKLVMAHAPDHVRTHVERLPFFRSRNIHYVRRWARKIREGYRSRKAKKQKNDVVQCVPLITRKILMRDIVSIVANETGIQLDEIVGSSRKKDVARARQVAMYLAYNARACDASVLKIGRYFKRDHSTVVYAVDKVSKDRDLLKLAMKIANKNDIELSVHIEDECRE